MALLGRREWIDLTISWLTISFAFAVLWKGLFNIGPLFDFLPISIVAVGTGFIFHELAHRNVARHFGAHAEYRAWSVGLVFAFISALVGFLFAAPGAVYIYGRNINARKNGIISAAGPAVNIIIAFIFLIIAPLVAGTQLLLDIAIFSARINFFLALFNLLPIGPLDGSKVFVWDVKVWVAMFTIAGAGVFLFNEVATIFTAILG
ncbi:MAG: site-2 protease family protein [Candidatus Diapherotrites archaeon]|nr:site-2 protease family protein [Candidatus Micrarchaeota archaeon]MBU1939398.1 site-2 protease family protein [Candidatus Micrarchaeota archaeon]